MHTTQFGIRDPRIGLFHPVLEIAAAEMSRADTGRITADISAVKSALNLRVDKYECRWYLAYRM